MVDFANGVSVTHSDDVSVIETQTDRQRRSLDGAEPGGVDLDRILADAEFELAADLTIRGEDKPLRRGDRRSEAARAPRIEVALDPNQRAVILIEEQGGVYHWGWPLGAQAEGRDRRAQGTDRAVFDLALMAAGQGAARPGERADDPARRRRGVPLLGLVGEKLIKPIRVRVLRFLARRATDALVNRIEGHVAEGPRCWDTVRGKWIAALPEIGDLGRPARILLLVHGTFSSTEASFAGLTSGTGDTAFPAAIAGTYDAVIGFDHKTLVWDPVENAQAMKFAFAGLPAGARIDAIAFSRGGLVYRVFEDAFRALRPDVEFGRVLFVGCTNSGTLLAEPENWEALVDLYTTIAMAAVRGASLLTGFAGVDPVSFVIRAIGDFVKVLPELAITEGSVPGLAAMRPGSATIRSLPTRTSDLVRYRALVSDFHPRIDQSRGITAEIAEFLINLMADRFFAQANDLVVHTDSMADFGAAGLLDPSGVHMISPAEQIYHTIYFSTPENLARVTALLLEMGHEKGAAPAAPSVPLPDPSPEAFAASPLPLPERRMRRGGGAGERAAPVAASPRRGDVPVPEAALEAAAQTEPAATAQLHLAAHIDAEPVIGCPMLVGVVISPEQIAALDGKAMDRGPQAVDVDTGIPLILEVTPLSNARLLTEGTREVPVPEQATTHWFLVEGFHPGKARIQIEVRQQSRALVVLLLEPVFVEGSASRIVQHSAAMMAEAGTDEPVFLRIYEIEQPDGKTLIKYNLESRSPRFAAIENSAGLSRERTEAFFADFLKQLDDSYNLGEQGYRQRKQELLGIAGEIADQIIPEKVRRALWDNRDQIEAIQVIADRSTIPWELLSITPPDGGEGDGRFLSEWGLLRRLPGAPWPGRRIDLDPAKARYVVPDYLDDSADLKFAQQERHNFVSHFPGARELEADQGAVRAFLASEAADCSVLHFACHGSASQGAVLSAGLKMQEERQVDGRLVRNTLTHSTVRQVARFGTEGPSCLVFLNACEAGRAGTHLQSDAVGFADAFLRPKSNQGAAIFIAAMWQIDDELALVFADSFYRGLGEGKNLVRALGDARVAIERKFDFTWLAFTALRRPSGQGPVRRRKHQAEAFPLPAWPRLAHARCERLRSLRITTRTTFRWRSHLRYPQSSLPRRNPCLSTDRNARSREPSWHDRR